MAAKIQKYIGEAEYTYVIKSKTKLTCQIFDNQKEISTKTLL